MFCTNCGNKLPDGADRCPVCGALTSNSENGQNAGQENGLFSQNMGQDAVDNYDNAGQSGEYPPIHSQSGAYQQNTYQQGTYQQDTYQQSSYQQNDYGHWGGGQSVLFNIPKRNAMVCILLSIVTCGLYGIYWMVCINDEVNMISGETDKTSGLMVVILSIVTCNIYAIYWIYQMGKRVDKARNMQGNSGILYLLLQFFGLGIVNYAIIQDVLNDFSNQE